MQLRNTDITHAPHSVVEVIPVEPLPTLPPSASYPDEYRDRILVDVPHDGFCIPEQFMVDGSGAPIGLEEIEADYIRERDWGAHLVAERLAASLGLSSYCQVTVARVLMDFGRFPGSTPRHAEHLNRFAINYPFSKKLSYLQKKCLLESQYDAVSDRMEELLAGKLIKIAVHTYDRLNDSGTERPPVSLMTRSLGYQTSSEMPWGLFDPLFPDVLAEFTADRILRDRMSLLLEKANIPVAHNYPYCLPEGSLEVRYQVWSFFRFLRQRIEAENPDSVSDPSYAMIWKMLLDTNLRSSESEALRSYLHMFRHARGVQRGEFERAQLAYEAIVAFVQQAPVELVEAYRRSPAHPSAIAVDVRKDVVCQLDGDGRPIRPNVKHINRVADTIAAAVATYLREDRGEQVETDGELGRTEPWYVTPG